MAQFGLLHRGRAGLSWLVDGQRGPPVSLGTGVPGAWNRWLFFASGRTDGAALGHAWAGTGGIRDNLGRRGAPQRWPDRTLAGFGWHRPCRAAQPQCFRPGSEFSLLRGDRRAGGDHRPLTFRPNPPDARSGAVGPSVARENTRAGAGVAAWRVGVCARSRRDHRHHRPPVTTARPGGTRRLRFPASGLVPRAWRGGLHALTGGASRLSRNRCGAVGLSPSS